MAQGVAFPNLNSEQFVAYPSSQSPLYHTKHFNQDLFQKSIPLFQRYNAFWDDKCPRYFQIKQFNDKLNFVLDSLAYDSYTIKWVKFDSTEIPYTGTITEYATPGNVYTANGSIAPQQLYTIQGNLLEISTDLTDAGMYFLVVEITTGANSKTYLSEPYNIKETWPQTVLIQYSDSQNQFDVRFDKSPNFELRIPAYLDYLTNKIEYSKFRDQRANLRQTYARDWRVFQLIIGTTMFPYGITPYHCDKLAKILKCDTIYIDGKRFIGEDGADFEPSMYGENYPMRTLTLQFAEYYVNDSDGFFGSETLELFELGTSTKFPYAVKDLTFTKIYGTGAASVNFNAVGIREIFNTTDELNYRNELNVIAAANGIVGGFAIIGDFMTFTNGINENYSANVYSLREAIRINGTSTAPSKNLTIRYTTFADSQLIISAWYTTAGNPTTIARAATYRDYTSSSDVLNIPTGSSATYSAFVYHNDRLKDMAVEGIASTSVVTSYAGGVPSSLEGFESDYTNIPTLDLAFLRRAAKNMIGFNFRRGTTTALAAGSLDVLEPGEWAVMQYFGLSLNAMNATQQDNFYIYFYGTIYAASYPQIYSIDTRVQTPASAPTATSATQRADIIARGNTISF